MLDALPFLLSPIAFLLMGVRGIPLIQYFAGQRRDLYFMPKERLWLFWQVASGFMIGSLALVCRLAQIEQTSAAVCCPGVVIYLILLVLVWAFLPGLALLWRPRWVIKMELELAPDDIELLVVNGTRMLQRYPKSFRSVISHPTGWELWMLTAVRPVRTRESSRQRAK